MCECCTGPAEEEESQDETTAEVTRVEDEPAKA